MIVLFDSSADLALCESECGLPAGQLITPLTGRRNEAADDGRPWALDNGCFASFSRRRYLSLLRREKPNRQACLFVTAPDVVGCHDRTLDLWGVWRPRLESWPVAFVAQDGCRPSEIPDDARALFVGGTNDFKTSPDARACAEEAKRRGLWVHVGRVNTSYRLDAWWELADSVDGSGIARYTHMRRALSAPALPLLGWRQEARRADDGDSR